MIQLGKTNILGISVDVVDYEAAVESIMQAATDRKPHAVTALAVHGLMVGVLDEEHRFRLNSLDLVVADGQPVRWALNWLAKARLKDRVYGPNLTVAVCKRAEQQALSVYFYGSTPDVLAELQEELLKRYPRLKIVGAEPSKFRKISLEEKAQVMDNIRNSGAQIVFVGLGCPRQEVWAYEFRESLGVPILAVGAAFPFLAGRLPQAPRWMQDRGLEWLFRLRTEPLRLWKRYVLLNPLFVILLAMQYLGIVPFRNVGRPPTEELLYG